MENVKVEYDNEPISWVDFDTIFDSDQEDTDATAKWTSVLAIDENGEQILYILVYTHFSEHTITISSIIEAVGGITMMFLYAAFCVIAVIVFLIRIFINPVYLDYLKEKKE